MTVPSTRRRLAAILAADAAGYTRLMQQDEPATVAALNEAREEMRESRRMRFRIGLNLGDVINSSFVCKRRAVLPCRDPAEFHRMVKGPRRAGVATDAAGA